MDTNLFGAIAIASCSLFALGVIVGPMYFEYHLKLEAIKKGIVKREDFLE